jgi:hypothetical protein
VSTLGIISRLAPLRFYDTSYGSLPIIGRLPINALVSPYDLVLDALDTSTLTPATLFKNIMIEQVHSVLLIRTSLLGFIRRSHLDSHI